MFCKHKYGEIKDGYQYCIKCNKAIVVPCNHVWETIDTIKSVITSMQGRREQVEYHLRCTRCGEITQRVLT